MIALVLVGVAIAVLPGREIPLPGWVAARIEAVAQPGLGGNRLDIGGVGLTIDQQGVPRVAFTDLVLTAPGGREIVRVPGLRAALDRSALLTGRVQPRSLRLNAARIAIRRDALGRFDLAFGGAMPEGGLGSVGDLLDALDATFALPGLEPIRVVEMAGVTVEFRDDRAGRAWEVGDGRLLLEQDAQQLSLRVNLSLTDEMLGPDAGPAPIVLQEAQSEAPMTDPEAIGPAAPPDAPSQLALSFSSRKGSRAATLAASVTGINGADIGAQAPALAWLEPLDAPISGAMRARVDDAGGLEAFYGTLEIGSGALQAGQGAAPVGFDGGRAYFRFDPEARRIDFDEVRLESPQLGLIASGHAYLEDLTPAGWPRAMVGQLRFSDVRLDPDGLWQSPAQFSDGALDVKVGFDPFRAELGQFLLLGDGVEITGKGEAVAEGRGWSASADIELGDLSPAQITRLWPVSIAAKTRKWLDDNITGGEVFDARAALRTGAGGTPQVSAVFEFRDAEVRVMRNLPPVTQARGYATLDADSFTVSVEAGQMIAPEGGTLDMAGTVFRVLDVKQKPAPAEITLRAGGPVTAALSLLDQPPLSLMTKAKRPVDLAQGQAEVEARIALVLKDRRTLPAEEKMRDVSWQVSGTLRDVRSDQVVPGQVLRAGMLALEASNEQIAIGGDATLSGLPLTAEWVNPLGPEGRGHSHVDGVTELSPRALDTFKIALPDGMVSGKGQAAFELELRTGEAPLFHVNSDLNRVGLSIPQIGWTKPASTRGSLMLDGRLGATPQVDTLTLTAPGLTAQGRISLQPSGAGLREARFDRVAAGWFDGAVTLSGRGRGVPPGVAVTGGQVDLRAMPEGRAMGGGTTGGAAREGAPITLALDRVTVSERIALTGFRGRLSTTGGLSGDFTAGVNGAGQVTGTLVPTDSGTALRLRSDNAGQVLAGSGLYQKGTGGTLDVSMRPRAPGDYDGSVKIENIRAQSAPGLAALLNTISVVGLLDQLNGPGLLFNEVEGVFRLTPTAVEITRASAVGPSLGLSVAGVIDLGRAMLNLQGVASPIYVVNSIGQVISRKGEGVFGVNYEMTGPIAQPDVSVNPLSFLTPGMFREIFRRPAPRLAE
ncbi:MAG: AsmA-like C-terminal region-containing protein [Celeribacter sp.]